MLWSRKLNSGQQRKVRVHLVCTHFRMCNGAGGCARSVHKTDSRIGNVAGGCARGVHTILEEQTQASLVLTPSVKFAVRSACLHRHP